MKKERMQGAMQMAVAAALVAAAALAAAAAGGTTAALGGGGEGYVTWSWLNRQEADREALQRLMEGMQEAPWPERLQKTWGKEGVGHCEWEGVECGGGGVVALHLAGMGLRGQIPAGSIGGLTELRSVILRGNHLSGPLPPDLGSCAHLRLLFLHRNGFSGAIPPLPPSLSRLNLAHNNLSGAIPPTISALLPGLTALLLHRNSFSGPLPDLRPILPHLRLLNLADNSLSGALPADLQQKFGAAAFRGNAFCGAPLFPPCNTPPQLPPPAAPAARRGARPSAGDIAAAVVGGVAAAVFAAACCTVWCVKRRRAAEMRREEEEEEEEEEDEEEEEEEAEKLGRGGGDRAAEAAEEEESSKLVFIEGSPYRFDVEELLRASAEVLGKGAAGTAYKAALEEGGAVVVVKRLRHVTATRRAFRRHVAEILADPALLRHPNLLPLRAFLYSKHEKLLIYDFLPLRSLADRLHGDKAFEKTTLDWDTRLKIALGAARGILFLHERGSAGDNKNFVHGNIKSSNVLLSTNYEVKLSDYALAPLLGSTPTASRVTGYKAPEVSDMRNVSQKADVYSFGVLLLEILTGRVPTQTSQDGVMDLPRWVQSIVREEWTAEVFDLELMRYQNIEGEMVQTLKIAIACVSTSPEQRPSMSEVVKMLEDVKPVNYD